MIASLINAKRFYKITRYLFGLNNAIKPHLDTMNREEPTNPFRQTKAARAMIEKLGRFRKQQSRLGAWLTGTDKLIHLLHEEINAADQKLESHLKKPSKPIEPHVNVKAAQQTHTEVTKHLKDRVAFVEQAPKRPPLFTIPYIFDTFGTNNGVYVQPLVNENKPANYRNLIEIQQENQKVIDNNRAVLNDCSDRLHEARVNAFVWPHAFGDTAEMWSYLPSNIVANPFVTHQNERSQHAGNAIDGAESAQRYAQRGLQWLNDSAPTLVVNEKGKPAWKQADLNTTQQQAMYPHRRFK